MNNSNGGIKALSVKQPWAWLLRKGHKNIENRSWKTNYRGWFFIHTGQQPDVERYDEACRMLREYNGKEIPPIEDLNTGGIVGKAELVDCVDRHVSPWWMDDTDYGFVIEFAHFVPFRECPGQMRFFEPDLDLSDEEPKVSGNKESDTKGPRRPY